jgi:hypothetical protein
MFKKVTFTLIALLFLFSLYTPVFADDVIDLQVEDTSPFCGENPAKMHPGIGKLSAIFNLDEATVLDLFCQGYGLGAIRHALRAAAIDPTIDVEKLLDEMELEEDAENEVEDVDELSVEDPDDLDDKSDSFYCRADTEKQHPTALRYAVHYAEMVGEEDISAAYDTIMIWFCEDNFGFGEIKHALKTAEKVGGEADPQTYLDRRTGGEGWGDIWQGLQLIGQGKPKLHPVFGANWPNENKNSTQEEGDPVVTGPQGKGKPNKPGK